MLMIKKIAAIFLLALFVFNLVGYKAVFYFIQQKADASLVASLDQETYNEKDLITITVPVSMPYQVNQPDFERVDGEINIKGQLYKYVKRKVENGQLVLLCLPNHEKMRLQSAKDDYSKMANDIAQNGSKKSDHSKNFSAKNISLDYDGFEQQYQQVMLTDCITYEKPSGNNILPLAAHHSPEQPPDFI